MIFLLDPANEDWGASAVREIKFTPVAMALVADAILLIGLRIKWSFPFVAICSFVLLMILGSLFSLLILDSDLEETYISRSLIAAVALWAGYLISQHEKLLHRLVDNLILMLLIYAWCVFILSVAYRLGVAFGDLAQIYQDQSTLVAVALVALMNRVLSPILTKISFVVFCVTLILIAKTTALLMLAIALAVYGHTMLSSFFSKLVDKGLVNRASIGTIVLVAIAALAILYQLRLDDRDNETREANMQIRIMQFADSPIVGDMFTGSPLVDFGPLHIPSHSEWLDMLASSGTLAILFLMLPIVLLVLKSNLISTSKKGLRLTQFLSIVVLSYSISMAVNPILFLPSLAVPFWLFLGMLAGVHSRSYDYFFGSNAFVPKRAQQLMRLKQQRVTVRTN